MYAQSNGKAEKGLHILKNIFKKASDGNSDPYLAFLSITCGVWAITWWATNENKSSYNTLKLSKAKEISWAAT